MKPLLIVTLLISVIKLLCIASLVIIFLQQTATTSTNDEFQAAQKGQRLLSKNRRDKEIHAPISKKAESHKEISRELYEDDHEWRYTADDRQEYKKEFPSFTKNRFRHYVFDEQHDEFINSNQNIIAMFAIHDINDQKNKDYYASSPIKSDRPKQTGATPKDIAMTLTKYQTLIQIILKAYDSI